MERDRDCVDQIVRKLFNDDEKDGLSLVVGSSNMDLVYVVDVSQSIHSTTTTTLLLSISLNSLNSVHHHSTFLDHTRQCMQRTISLLLEGRAPIRLCNVLFSDHVSASLAVWAVTRMVTK